MVTANEQIRAAAEQLSDAVEDYLFTEDRSEQALRAAWQRYVDEMAEVDGES